MENETYQNVRSLDLVNKDLWMKRGMNDQTKDLSIAPTVKTNWHSVVQFFTACDLTYQKDVLPAIQGVARHMQHDRQCAYYAGLWDDNIWFDLLWTVNEPGRVETDSYRAPSWS